MKLTGYSNWLGVFSPHRLLTTLADQAYHVTAILLNADKPLPEEYLRRIAGDVRESRNLLNDGHGPGKDVGERAEGSSGAAPAKSPTSPSPTSARAPVAHSPSPEDAPEAPRAVVQPHSGEVRPGHPNAEIQNMEDIWDSTVFAAQAFSKAGARAVRTRPRMTTIAAACRDIDTLRERSRHPDRLYRWQIFQSRPGAWCVLPPLYPVAGGDAPRWFPTFEAARAAFAAGKETRAGA